jgi:hypothetical protein
MRPLTKLEEKKLKVLSEKSVSYTLIEPTATGLGKSIMDATGQVRSYLKEKRVHDYSTQGTGAIENGINLDSLFYTRSEIITSQASLYRPKAKGNGGDPRIWFTKLKTYAFPNDILVLISFDNKLHVLNLTQLPINDLIHSHEINPIKELVIAIEDSVSEIANELLFKLKEIANRGFIKSLVNSDTGVGRTLESLLGIEMNSSKTPDYKGIELKSFRDSRTTRKGLFAKTPNWSLSKFKSRVEILDNFGYEENGILRLYNTIRATGRNAQGLILRISYENDWLLENSDKPDIGDFLVWELKVLRDALRKKHKETFWISSESKIQDGDEYFLYKSAEHTKNPLINQFEMLIEIGAITLDYPIKRTSKGSLVDKGCNFKLKASCLDLLFPKSNLYDLLSA